MIIIDQTQLIFIQGGPPITSNSSVNEASDYNEL